MPYPTAALRLRRLIAATLLTTQVAACSSWTSSAISPEALHGQRRVRVTTWSGLYELYDPVIRNDSLVGTSMPHASDAGYSSSPHGFPLEAIHAVEVRQPDGGKTMLTVLGVGLTAIVVAAVVADEDPPPPPPPPRSSEPIAISCPLVYSWDGTTWRLDSGTFGGAISRGFARTDVDNLEYAIPEDDRIRLRITAELDETEYVDRVQVVAVDHDPAVTVAPDPSGGIHTIAAPREPVSAQDDAGRDVLDRIRARDGWNWESRLVRRDTADRHEVRDGVELTFVRPAGAADARLVVDATNTPWASYLMYAFLAARGSELQAWYDSVDAMPAYAAAARDAVAREAFLSVSIRGDGQWESQGVLWEAGPEVVKRQVLPLDLRGITGDTVRVRLESAPSFWLLDYVAVDFSAPSSVETHTLMLEQALDRNGNDVRVAIGDEDERYYVMERGDAAELTFVAPPESEGRARSYLLRSTGWYRIHANATGPADRAVLDAIGRVPLALSRAATARLNAALVLLADR